MIDHLYIKNYKAFERENIPLDRFTLLIGSHDSGKTTVLEALDLFFNHTLNRDSIRDKSKDVIIEIHVDDDRYRKVFKSPHYELDYSKCIGNLYDINHIKYLYIKKDINNAKLLNDILSINLTKKMDSAELQSVVKVFDYIDGKLGNSNYPIFKVDTKYEMAVPNHLMFTKEEYTNIVSNITYQYLIIGIDNFEDNFVVEQLKKITQYSYQVLFATNDQSVIHKFDYHLHALYKDDIKEDYETIKKHIRDSNNKTYLLVEGKYDVGWFETALRLLDKQDDYRVIPCGGYGNIEFVEKQLNKEGFKTIVITDGDTKFDNALKREIIELYADLGYVNKRFNVDFENMPESKYTFFKRIKVKDDIVKKVLSSWARKRLTKDNEFVLELNTILKSN